MLRLPTLSSIVAVAALLVACQKLYGINRVGEIPSMPELNCVEGAIRSVPEVEDVRRWEDRGSYPLTWTGIKKPDRLYYFEYETGRTIATIVLSVDYAGKVEYRQHRYWRDPELAREEVKLIRPVMIAIELRMEQRCSIRTLFASIEEYCGVDECAFQ